MAIGPIATTTIAMRSVWVGILTAVSMPVIVAGLLVDVAFGFLNRVAGQVHVFFLAMPIKALLGIAVVLLALVAMIEIETSRLEESSGWLRWLLDLMGS